MELRQGMEVFNNSVPVRLIALAEVVRDVEVWWVMKLLIVPPYELMEFDTHRFYKACTQGRLYE